MMMMLSNPGGAHSHRASWKAAILMMATAATSHLTALEKTLVSVPSAATLRSHMFNITQQSHIMGSPGDFANAQYVADALTSSGAFDEVRIETVDVMLTFPSQPPKLTATFTDTLDNGTTIEEQWSAKLSEDLLSSDPTTDVYWRNRTFNAYSASGTVTGRVVYANYGMPSDFDALEALGVSVSGAIALTRYGGCFRGLKAMNAEARGAIGTLIYSDPGDDGFAVGPTYPDGPWRPPSGVQRGSAQYLSRCAGDPYRLYLDDDPCGNITWVPQKPVLPISYEDAYPLLSRMAGPAAPASFIGGFPPENLTYTVGPSPFEATLDVAMTFEPGQLPNVVAEMKGSSASNEDDDDKVVYAGNHRDAWVYGAVDPHSGTVALLEAARAFGSLRKEQNWTPKRSIVFCSWSGEEYGLLGSTAFAELNAQNISENAIAYVNLDVAVSGNATLEGSGTQSLDILFAEAVNDIDAMYPEQQIARKFRAHRGDDETKKAVGANKLGTLGSGSDYTAFIDNLGVPSVDFSFKSEGGRQYGTYHSIYDSFTYIDDGFSGGWDLNAAAAGLFALTIYRLADRAVLPIRPITQAIAIEAYVAELANYTAANNYKGLDLTVLEIASRAMFKASACVALELEALPKDATSDEAQDLNDRLATYERRFLSPPGLPDRTWYKHVLQAPGYYLGYGSTAFPGVYHALEDDDLDQAQSQIDEAAERVHAAAACLCGNLDDMLSEESSNDQIARMATSASSS